jgi:hypothetical protein
MWRKTLGLALLALVFVVLSGCAAHHRAYYRDGHSPGYVQVRVGAGHGNRAFVRGRSHGPSYRGGQYRYYRNPGRNFHHRHYRGCGHRW